MKEDFLNINFEITHDCNQNCKYCYNRSVLNSSNSSGIPIKTIKELFKLINIKHLTFTGGEPLISKDLLECIIHARINNAETTIITNGSTENKALLDNLLRIGANRFQITINSYNSIIHDKLTLVNGSWNKTLKNVEYILHKGGRVIPTIIVTQSNFENIEKTLEFIKKLGLNIAIINRYNLSQGNNLNDLIISKKNLNEVFIRINNYALKNGLTVISNVCTPYCVLNPKDFEGISFGQCPTNPKEKPITIDFAGNVRLCNHSPKIVGNIFKEDLNEMLFSQHSLGWTSNIPEFCSDCLEYDECKGGCRAASEQMKGSYMFVDPIIENK